MNRTIQTVIGIQLCLVLILSCSILNRSLKYQESIIYEGKGIDEIKLESLTINDVIPKLGKQYEIIEWGEYSYEYKYPKVGISFWYKQSDKKKNIISISVYTDRFRGETSKGLKISEKMNLQEIIEIYGNPEWGYAADDVVADAEYEDLGIYFSFQKIKEEDEVIGDNEKELYMTKNPVEIVIGKVGTDY